jgi:magnesium-transporting ATPase (P-type)
MITGDHPQTAMSIGQMLGITNSSQAMTGYQLEHMDDAELAKAAVEYDIFARTSRSISCAWSKRCRITAKSSA